MKFDKYLKSLKKPLRPGTITFLIKNNKVLLGFKKRGFGKGNWLGIGGKVEPNEEIVDAAKREISEEINVKLNRTKHVGILNFYFPHIADESWNQQVHVFIAISWKGEPQETEEIKPQWFEKENIPYDLMWDDASYWLPKILDNKKVKASFTFDKHFKVLDHLEK